MILHEIVLFISSSFNSIGVSDRWDDPDSSSRVFSSRERRIVNVSLTIVRFGSDFMASSTGDIVLVSSTEGKLLLMGVLVVVGIGARVYCCHLLR